MDGKVMVVLIMLVIFGATTLDRWLKLKTVQAKNGNDDLLDAQAQEIKDLRARVEVLEKIVTNKSHRLSQEIDAL